MNHLPFGWSITGVLRCIVQRNRRSRPSDNGGVRGGGGGGFPKKFFSALRASFWSKNKRRGEGGGGGAPEPLPSVPSVTAARRRMHVLLNGKVYVYNRNVCDYE